MPVMIWRASPSWISEGSSPTIDPTTAAGAAIRNPVNKYGREAGSRSLRRMAHFEAAYDPISPLARGSNALGPRSAAIVTGKNVRYVDTIATPNQSALRPMTMSGAIAMVGVGRVAAG